MDSRITPERSRIGDPFTATLRTPIADARGRVLVPAGARLTGTITAVRRAGSGGGPGGRPGGGSGLLRLDLESLTSGRHSFPISAEITEMREVAASVRAGNSGSGGGGAALGAAVGAAAGALVGAAVGGDFAGALGGAAIGAGAGTLLSIARRGRQNAVVDEGTQLTLRLTRPLTISSER